MGQCILIQQVDNNIKNIHLKIKNNYYHTNLEGKGDENNTGENNDQGYDKWP